MRRAKDVLRLIHSYLSGRIHTPALSGCHYFITFIIHISRRTWVYILKNKNEALIKFKDWKLMVEIETGKRVKCLRSDNGGDYISKEFSQYLVSEAIKRELTLPRNLQQTGVSERMNRILIESVRAMLSDSVLAKKFWAELVTTTAYIRN
uniref:Integrase catalytic domain-containing protein n=1 Tax=Lepeophtheirus salmonis TaxID=72036 RepID=A0A0K2UV26_LEPSM